VPSKEYTIQELSELIGIEEKHVVSLVKDGTIKAKWQGPRRTKITEKALEAYQARLRPYDREPEQQRLFDDPGGD